ncbi:MAG: hypothetical protein KAZ69_18125, partial [Candidatus Microthrix sp.]|nr:hypothetical protein [Candidatus Microthrix sp.]
ATTATPSSTISPSWCRRASHRLSRAERFGLADAAHRNAGTYSLGMRQRLGLDPQGTRTLRDLLRTHAANGGTVLVSSHTLAEVEHLADDVIVINRGRLVTHGALEELILTWTSELTAPDEDTRS